MTFEKDRITDEFVPDDPQNDVETTKGWTLYHNITCDLTMSEIEIEICESFSEIDDIDFAKASILISNHRDADFGQLVAPLIRRYVERKYNDG